MSDEFGRGTDDEARPRAEEPITPVLTPLVRILDAAGAITVLVMVAIVNVDVFGRFFANRPLVGTLELTEMGIIAIVFLVLARTVAVRRLTRSETLLDILRRRADKVNLMLRTGFNLCGALVMAVIIWGQFPRLVDAWSRGYFKGNVGIFTAPTWPLEAIVLIGATLAAIQFLVMARRNLKALQDVRSAS